MLRWAEFPRSAVAHILQPGYAVDFWCREFVRARHREVTLREAPSPARRPCEGCARIVERMAELDEVIAERVAVLPEKTQREILACTVDA